MQRRGFFKSILAVTGLAAGALATRAAVAAPNKQKVAYHLTDLDRAQSVLGNIQNHLNGVGGPGNVEIILVVHGPALKAFEDISANPPLKAAHDKLKASKVSFAACGNTLNSLKLDVADLVPGFVRVDQGGVVKLAELQAQGYVYLRP
jgi:intracellular sulfur oxidation DsrE/DsrF family protein